MRACGVCVTLLVTFCKGKFKILLTTECYGLVPVQVKVAIIHMLHRSELSLTHSSLSVKRIISYIFASALRFGV